MSQICRVVQENLEDWVSCTRDRLLVYSEARTTNEAGVWRDLLGFERARHAYMLTLQSCMA